MDRFLGRHFMELITKDPSRIRPGSYADAYVFSCDTVTALLRTSTSNLYGIGPAYR